MSCILKETKLRMHFPTLLSLWGATFLPLLLSLLDRDRRRDRSRDGGRKLKVLRAEFPSSTPSLRKWRACPHRPLLHWENEEIGDSGPPICPSEDERLELCEVSTCASASAPMVDPLYLPTSPLYLLPTGFYFSTVYLRARGRTWRAEPPVVQSFIKKVKSGAPTSTLFIAKVKSGPSSSTPPLRKWRNRRQSAPSLLSVFGGGLDEGLCSSSSRWRSGRWGLSSSHSQKTKRQGFHSSLFLI